MASDRETTADIMNSIGDAYAGRHGLIGGGGVGPRGRAYLPLTLPTPFHVRHRDIVILKGLDGINSLRLGFSDWPS